MAAGRLRDRITIQRAIPGEDGYGNTVSGWVDHLTVWADVLERLGAERIQSGAIEAPRMATIRVRASTASRQITEADRISMRGVFWNIRSIAAVGRDGAMIEMLCEAQVAV